MTKVAVVIASKGRPELLKGTLESLAKQNNRPEQVIISLVDQSDAPNDLPKTLNIIKVFGSKGATRQINRAIDLISEDVDVVCLFDDDVELHCAYITTSVNVLNSHPEVDILNGTCISNQEVGREQALNMVNSACQSVVEILLPLYHVWGCNIVSRRRTFDVVRMDERLPLYGWLWDVDWSVRAARAGFRAFRSSAPLFVHLHTQVARLPGLGIGFSQIMNPAYFFRKGVLVSGWYDLIVRNFLKCIAINSLFLIKGDKRIDRWGRLRGNFIALGYIFAGRVEPELLEKVILRSQKSR